MSIQTFINKWNASQTVTSLNIHAWFSCVVVYHVTKGSHWPLQPVVLGWIVLTALKEFWYDKHYETPTQTFAESAVDFAGYVLGVLFAVGFTLAGI